MWASGVRSDSNSGQPVANSGPGLSRANNSSDARSNAEGLPSSSQPKSWWGCGGRAPAMSPEDD
jgi:hypothetical protein